MARAFSGDLRIRVLAASRDGMSARSAAARFGIGVSTAIAWIASARTGRLTPGKQGRRGGSRLDAHEDFIVGMIEEAKDITLNKTLLRLHEERAVSIGRSALDVWLRRRGWKAFAKLKAVLRDKAERTVEGLWNTVGKIVTLQPDRCDLAVWELRTVSRTTVCSQACRAKPLPLFWKAAPAEVYVDIQVLSTFSSRRGLLTG